VDWLHERPGVTWEFGDGKGNFKRAGHLEIAQTRNEFNMHPADLNGDGFIDLVVHWGRYDLKEGKSRVYLNDGKMNFREATSECGLKEDGLTIKGIGDVNQDGTLDLMAFEGKSPAIFLNDGKAHFTRKPDAIGGMQPAGKPNYTSWGLAVVTDFNNDGLADIIWNGRNFLWLLQGTGQGAFAYANKQWAVDDKSSATVDDGLCFGDIDGDGDLDVVGYTGSIEGQRMLNVYRNDSPAQNKWLLVQLIGAPGNRGAAGAKVRIFEAGKPSSLLWFEQVQILDSQMAHSYYSVARTERHFGLGTRTNVDISVEFYPSGERVEKKAIKANSMLIVAE
jgi:hypothetical protein